MVCYAPAAAKVRKQFFFEKKNQKTFVLLAYANDTTGTYRSEEKFFGSFFQKRTACFLTAVAE
jgi:hypothetical protein